MVDQLVQKKDYSKAWKLAVQMVEMLGHLTALQKAEKWVDSKARQKVRMLELK